jgi:hypothetical protein
VRQCPFQDCHNLDLSTAGREFMGMPLQKICADYGAFDCFKCCFKCCFWVFLGVVLLFSLFWLYAAAAHVQITAGSCCLVVVLVVVCCCCCFGCLLFFVCLLIDYCRFVSTAVA